jgi:hypothetical protein
VDVIERISRRFSPEECDKLAEMLDIISEELMPEILASDLPDGPAMI